VAKPEWGVKRICQACGARYYDFSRTPIVCPSCEVAFDPEAVLKSRRARNVPADKKVEKAKAPEAESEEEEAVEEAEAADDESEDDADAAVAAVVVDGDDEIEDDDDDDDDDTALLDDASDLDDDDGDVPAIPEPDEN